MKLIFVTLVLYACTYKQINYVKITKPAKFRWKHFFQKIVFTQELKEEIQSYINLN